MCQVPKFGLCIQYTSGTPRHDKASIPDHLAFEWIANGENHLVCRRLPPSQRRAGRAEPRPPNPAHLDGKKRLDRHSNGFEQLLPHLLGDESWCLSRYATHWAHASTLLLFSSCRPICSCNWCRLRLLLQLMSCGWQKKEKNIKTSGWKQRIFIRHFSIFCPSCQ